MNTDAPDFRDINTDAPDFRDIDELIAARKVIQAIRRFKADRRFGSVTVEVKFQAGRVTHFRDLPDRIERRDDAVRAASQ